MAATEASRRIGEQLERARRDARVRTLRATTLPLSIGVLLSLLGAWLNGDTDRPLDWIETLGATFGMLGWGAFLSSLDPTSDVMPLVGATTSIGVFSLNAIGRGGAALAAYASIEPVCASVAPALLMSGRLAVFSAVFCAALVALVVGLASWRAHTRGAEHAGASDAFCGLPPLTTRRLVDHIWICSGCIFVGLGFDDVYLVVVTLVVGERCALSAMTTMLICWCTAALCWSKTVRVRVQAFLISGGEPIATAAGLTSLLGGADATTIQASITAARERFRAIPFDALDESALAQATPPGRHADYWYEQSMPASVGECDAFVSHSWWDPAPSKWAALKRWAEGFEREHLRQPIVWLDRACIQQTDVQADLQYLPIYLAASKQLVVLAGPTYLSRMWCVVELFVYDQMWPAKATPPQHARPLDDGELGTALEISTAHKVVMMMLPGLRAEQLATFNAAHAKSAAASDYERLLRCVEVGCGSVESFNVRARLLLTSAFRVEHEEGARALAGKQPAETASPRRLNVARRPPAAGANAELQPSDSGDKHFDATLLLWARTCALGVALFALVGARALRPALADCARAPGP